MPSADVGAYHDIAAINHSETQLSTRIYFLESLPRLGLLGDYLLYCAGNAGQAYIWRLRLDIECRTRSLLGSFSSHRHTRAGDFEKTRVFSGVVALVVFLLALKLRCAILRMALTVASLATKKLIWTVIKGVVRGRCVGCIVVVFIVAFASSDLVAWKHVACDFFELCMPKSGRWRL